MEVDVEIEAASDLEDARDLSVRIAVGIGAAADQVGAGLAGRDQQLLGAGIVEQALLRKHADLQVDRPGVVPLQALNGCEAFQSDARIDLDMRAHARGALHDRLLQRAPAARVDIVLREGALGGGDLRDRLLQRALLAMAAIENAGLVEMDVGLDEARLSPAGRRHSRRRIGRNRRRDLDDSAAGDADIERRWRHGRRCGHCGRQDRA